MNPLMKKEVLKEYSKIKREIKISEFDMAFFLQYAKDKNKVAKQLNAGFEKALKELRESYKKPKKEKKESEKKYEEQGKKIRNYINTSEGATLYSRFLKNHPSYKDHYKETALRLFARKKFAKEKKDLKKKKKIYKRKK